MIRGNRALVTGATGYIGGLLVHELKNQGMHVIAIAKRDNANGVWDKYYSVDLAKNSPPAEAFKDVDVVFHLAGLAHRPDTINDELFWEVNVGGTRRVLDAMRINDVPAIVFFSSVAVFSVIGADSQDSVSVGRQPTAYALSKYDAEKMVLGEECIKHSSVLRPPLVYGRKCPGNLNLMINAIRHHIFPPVPTIQNRRSMIHVSDLVDAAIMTAGQSVANRKIYVVSDGREYSTGEIYGWIRKALGRSQFRYGVPLRVLSFLATIGDLIGSSLGKKLPFNSDVLEKLTGDAWYPSDEIRQDLGFKPKYNLHDTIDNIVKCV